MDETNETMTFPFYTQHHSPVRGEVNEGEFEHDYDSIEGVLQITQNWVHNLQHLELDPQVYEYSVNDAGEYWAGFARKTAEEWRAIELEAERRLEESEERRRRQFADQLFGQIFGGR